MPRLGHNKLYEEGENSAVILLTKTSQEAILLNHSFTLDHFIQKQWLCSFFSRYKEELLKKKVNNKKEESYPSPIKKLSSTSDVSFSTLEPLVFNLLISFTTN